MKYLSAAQLQEIGTRILDAAGSPHAESETVCEVLVRANLLGHDSHGVMRIPQYVGEIPQWRDQAGHTYRDRTGDGGLSRHPGTPGLGPW